jgi:hypothetical protein
VEFIDDSIFVNRVVDQEPKGTRKLLGQLVLKRLKGFDLNIDCCVGVATDGCLVITSQKVGLVKEVLVLKIFTERLFIFQCLTISLLTSLAAFRISSQIL